MLKCWGKTRVREILSVSLFFLVLSLLFTYPLIFYFLKGMPYVQVPAEGYELVPIIQGDHLQFYYYLWLGKDALLGRTPFFKNPYEFNAEEEHAPFTTQLFPLSVLFLILSIGGDLFAYNSLLILCIILSGVICYYLAKFYVKEKIPAVLGAVIFTFAPFRVGQLLGGHLNGFIIFLLPAIIYFYELSFEKGRVLYGVLAGSCFLLLAVIGEHHLTYYCFLITCIYLPLRFIFTKERGKAVNALIAIILFLFLSFCFLLFLKKVLFAGSVAGGGRELHEVRLFSPSPVDLVRKNTEIEKLIYPGIPVFLLAVSGFISGIWKKFRVFPLWQVLFYTVLFTVSLLLALGPSSPLYRFAYAHIPYFNLPRSPGRIISVSFLAMSVLAAQGLFAIGKLLARYVNSVPLPDGSIIFRKILRGILSKNLFQNAVYFFFIAGILFDYHPRARIGVSLPERENRIYDYIKENIGSSRVLELPIWPGDTSWSSIYQYYVTKTRARMINGYSPAVSRKYVEETFLPLYPLDFGELRDEQHKLLRKLDVKYVIGHAEAFPVKVSPFPFEFTLENLKSSPYLEFLDENGPISLFRVAEGAVEKKQVFKQSSIIGHIYEAERLRRRTGRIIQDSQASGEYAVLAEPGKDREGHLAFGPYRTFPSGDYVALFRLKPGGKSPDKVAFLDVCGDSGKKILAGMQLDGIDFSEDDVYQDFLLPFTVNCPTPLEFRVYYMGEGALRVDYVYVRFREEKEPLLSFEAEELFHIARAVDEEGASGGRALFADRESDPADYLTSGPYRRYSAGEYEALFRLKVGEIIPAPVAKLHVTKGYSRDIVAERIISGVDFSDVSGYQGFRLPFKLYKEEVLEFTVFFEKEADLWIDSIQAKHIP